MSKGRVEISMYSLAMLEEMVMVSLCIDNATKVLGDIEVPNTLAIRSTFRYYSSVNVAVCKDCCRSREQTELSFFKTYGSRRMDFIG